jgi:hypothetical protein
MRFDGESGFAYQARNMRIVLGARGLRCMWRARDDMVRREREWLEVLSLLRNNVLSEKGRSSPSMPHLDFKIRLESPRGIPGPH